MSITATAKTMILETVIAKSIDNIDVLSLSNVMGEIHRIAPQKKETISNQERKYTFYLTEVEAVDTIIKMSLYGDGATVGLGTGTEMVEQTVDITKTSAQSLLIHWHVRVVV